MKAIYLLSCLLSYRHYLSYIESVFVKQEIRSKVSNPKCGGGEGGVERASATIFPKEEFYLIVYNNLVITLTLALVLVYGAILLDRTKAVYNGESEEKSYLSMLMDSPLFGPTYMPSRVLGKLLMVVLVHYLVVLVYLSVTNRSLQTRRQARTESLFVYGLSAIFTVIVL